MCEVILRDGQADVVAEVAIRIYENYYQPRNVYAPQFNFTLCETDPRGCQERQKDALEFQFPQLDGEIVAVGCAINFFETEPSKVFLETRTFSSDVEYLESFGEPGYGNSNIWLTISVEPIGLESYQADDIVRTLTY